MTSAGGGEVDRLKREAARRALDYVRDGMVLGLGSGTTSEIFVAELGERVRAGLRVSGVPSSRKIEAMAARAGVPLASLDDHPRLDLDVDGADEIEPRTLSLIKGGGGSLLREKLVAVACRQVLIVGDESKLVETLGQRWPVPVEVVRFGWRATAERLARLGCRPELRIRDGAPFVTDEHHHVLDCHFGPIADPPDLAEQIKLTVGVVEHGLFIGIAHRALVAGRDGVRVLERMGDGP